MISLQEPPRRSTMVYIIWCGCCEAEASSIKLSLSVPHDTLLFAAFSDKMGAMQWCSGARNDCIFAGPTLNIWNSELQSAWRAMVDACRWSNSKSVQARFGGRDNHSHQPAWNICLRPDFSVVGKVLCWSLWVSQRALPTAKMERARAASCAVDVKDISKKAQVTEVPTVCCDGCCQTVQCHPSGPCSTVSQ